MCSIGHIIQYNVAYLCAFAALTLYGVDLGSIPQKYTKVWVMPSGLACMLRKPELPQVKPKLQLSGQARLEQH
jgi:hypothetical protein